MQDKQNAASERISTNRSHFHALLTYILCLDAVFSPSSCFLPSPFFLITTTLLLLIIIIIVGPRVCTLQPRAYDTRRLPGDMRSVEAGFICRALRAIPGRIAVFLLDTIEFPACPSMCVCVCAWRFIRFIARRSHRRRLTVWFSEVPLQTRFCPSRSGMAIENHALFYSTSFLFPVWWRSYCVFFFSLSFFSIPFHSLVSSSSSCISLCNAPLSGAPKALSSRWAAAGEQIARGFKCQTAHWSARNHFHQGVMRKIMQSWHRINS